VTLDEIAWELYGRLPADFTAERNAKAKEAKQAGDKDLAAAITALAKPTMVGWLANQLIRQYPDEMHALLELGESLREATASLAGDQLKELSRQQRQVVYALVHQARGLASAAGHPASEDTARGLEETLHAALADPAAAGQLSAGRLTGVLSRSGFPGDAPPRSKPAPRTPSSEDNSLEQAQRAEEEARSAAAEAAEEHDKAQAALDDATVALTDAEERLEDLKRQLSEAGEAQVQAQRRLRSARETAERADRSARRTAQKLADAEARTSRLGGTTSGK
jgi:hypothetical protein